LLHGGSGSWTHWIRNIPTLVACSRQVWAPDLPGFADSASPPGGGDADAVVGPLALGLHEAVGPGPHEIAAFSFGSLVAVLLAAQQPGLVARLLLVGLPVLPLHHGRGVALVPMRAAVTPQNRAAGHRANLAAIMLHQASRIDSDTVALQAANAARDRMRSRRPTHAPLPCAPCHAASNASGVPRTCSTATAGQRSSQPAKVAPNAKALPWYPTLGTRCSTSGPKRSTRCWLRGPAAPKFQFGPVL
jgi:pimeloyl-ACP methyl ester carboxylesterase